MRYRLSHCWILSLGAYHRRLYNCPSFSIQPVADLRWVRVSAPTFGGVDDSPDVDFVQSGTKRTLAKG